jgi:glycosyltransferase involved in cell wall biosynthesis
MNNRPRALVILSPAFAADENDSRLPSQESLVRHFNRMYPSVRIIILTFHFPVRKDKEYDWYGNRVITFSGDMKGKLHSLLLWKSVWQELSRLQQAYRLAGIFSFFCSECAFIGHYFSRRHKLNHKIWVLGQDARKNNPQVRRIKPKPEELIVISDFLQREFEQNHRIKPAHIIPIGIDTSLFPTHAMRRNIDLLGAGSLIPLKQYDQLVAATAEIAGHYPGLRSVLLGNGPEETALQKQIGTLQLDQCLTMPGKQSRTDTLAYMQRSKIFLHPSAYEGLGMVCLEALYAGAHVISFCKPLDIYLEQWHVVSSKEEMAAKALALLQSPATSYNSALPYRMEETAMQLMQLFVEDTPVL